MCGFHGKATQNPTLQWCRSNILLVCLRLRSDEDAEHCLRLLNPSRYELDVFLQAVIYILEFCGLGFLSCYFTTREMSLCAGLMSQTKWRGWTLKPRPPQFLRMSYNLVSDCWIIGSVWFCLVLCTLNVIKPYILKILKPSISQT